MTCLSCFVRLEPEGKCTYIFGYIEYPHYLSLPQADGSQLYRVQKLSPMPNVTALWNAWLRLILSSGTGTMAPSENSDI